MKDAKRGRKGNFTISAGMDAKNMIFTVYEIIDESPEGKPLFSNGLGLPVTDQNIAEPIMAGSISSKGQSTFDFGESGVKMFATKQQAFKYFSLIGEIYQMAENNFRLDDKKLIRA